MRRVVLRVEAGLAGSCCSDFEVRGGVERPIFKKFLLLSFFACPSDSLPAVGGKVFGS